MSKSGYDRRLVPRERATFISHGYCLVGALYPAVPQSQRLRHGGVAPELTDPEVSTRASCGEYLNHNTATDRCAYFWSHSRHFFPKLTERSLCGRQAASLWQLTALSQRRVVVRSGPAQEPVPPLDTRPLPVWVYPRAPRARGCRPDADDGHGAAKQLAD